MHSHPWRKRLLIAAGLIAVWLLIVGVPPSLMLSPADRAHYETLRNAEYFASRTVGYGAVEPPEARAFMALAAHPRGGTAFKYILLRGTMAGRIYALVGLRRTNPVFFSVVVQPFRFWPGEVVTFFGCILSAEPVKTLIASDQPHPVRLERGQTLVDWYRTRPRGETVLDVIGGGYTSMFLEWEELARPMAPR